MNNTILATGWRVAALLAANFFLCTSASAGPILQPQHNGLVQILIATHWFFYREHQFQFRAD